MGTQKSKAAAKGEPALNPQPSSAPVPDTSSKPSNLDLFFAQFTSTSHPDESRTEIDPMGLQRLCEQIGVDPASDVAVLVLAWKCRTQTMGTITKEEFLRGLAELQVDSLTALRRKTGEMREMVQSPSAPNYKDFYRFVFDISREPGSKVLDVDTAVALLDMLLCPSFPLAVKFKAFLGVKEGLRAISVDQWMSFLEFCKQHQKSLDNYDSDGACKF